MGPVPREKLVPELFSQRDAAREEFGWKQPLEQVVVASVAVASREAEHARDGVRLEHGAHGVCRHPEPVGRRPALALEIERRQRALRADPFEHPLGHLGVLGEDARRVLAQRRAEPRELARRDEGESLVVGLEDLAALVEEVAPGGVVVGHARVEHEVVVASGNREGVELDRAESTEDLEHGVGASLERTRRRERVARDEKATGGLGRDPHAGDAIRRRAESVRESFVRFLVAGRRAHSKLLLPRCGIPPTSAAEISARAGVPNPRPPA